MIWTYSIVDDTVPAGVDPMGFRTTVAKAMRYVESASGENVRFIYRGFLRTDAKEQPTRHVNIGFDTAPDIVVGQESAIRTHDGRTVYSIALDPRTKWQSRWWHKWLTQRPDMYTVIVHELGHLLGLDHNHDLDGGSVMSEGAAFSTFSAREIGHLKRLAVLLFSCGLLSGCGLYTLNEQTRPHFETPRQKADREAAEVAAWLNRS